jgi:hypothetical protein
MGCNANPITISATPTPPAGNTVNSVVFYVDGVSIGSDNTSPYSYTYASPIAGAHVLTTVANWSVASPSTSSAVNITVGGGLKLTSTVPTIDGTVDAIWNSYTSIPLPNGNGASGADFSATYKMMFDATNLYLLVQVTDDVKVRDGTGGIWEDDGVEVFIDMGNTRAGTYGANDYQYSFNWNSATLVENKHGASALVGVTLGQANTAGGYTMELKFPWSTLGSPTTAGSYMGFDISVNDDDNSGTRDNQLSWYDATFGAWNNSALLGSYQFLDCNPLPITLLTFVGELKSGKAFLYWSTASETNNEKFIVERSRNRNDWRAIGEVSGAGSSASLRNYSFVDQDAIEGVVYYRLRQVDFDGAFANSKMVALESENAKVSVVPNPFENALTIKSNAKGNIEISIYDVLGRLLFYTRAESVDGALMIWPEVPSGTYFLTLQSNTFFEQQTIVKK